ASSRASVSLSGVSGISQAPSEAYFSPLPRVGPNPRPEWPSPPPPQRRERGDLASAPPSPCQGEGAGDEGDPTPYTLSPTPSLGAGGEVSTASCLAFERYWRRSNSATVAALNSTIRP